MITYPLISKSCPGGAGRCAPNAVWVWCRCAPAGRALALQLLSAGTTGHPEDICNPAPELRMDSLPLGCCPTAAVLCPAGDAQHCLQRWLCFGRQGWVYLKHSLFLPCPLWCVSVGDAANGHPDTSGHNVLEGLRAAWLSRAGSAAARCAVLQGISAINKHQCQKGQEKVIYHKAGQGAGMQQG